MKREVWEGLRYVFGTASLRTLTIASSAINFFVAGIQAVIVLYLSQTPSVAPGLLGVLLACGGVGGIAGAWLAGLFARKRAAGSVLSLALILAGLSGGLILLAQAVLPAMTFALGYSLLNAGIAAFSVVSVSYRQAICPSELLGRMVGSTRVVSWGSLPIGAFLIGALGEATSVSVGMAVALVGLFTVCLLAGASRRLRAAASGASL